MKLTFFGIALILIFCDCYPVNRYYPVLSESFPRGEMDDSKFIYSQKGLSVNLQGEYYSPVVTSIVADFKLEVFNSTPDTIKIEKNDIGAEYEDRNVGTEVHFNSSYTKPDSSSALVIKPHSKLKRWLVFRIPSENVRFYDMKPYLKVSLKIKRAGASETEDIPLTIKFVTE